jgi:hypothetical protein
MIAGSIDGDGILNDAKRNTLIRIARIIAINVMMVYDHRSFQNNFHEYFAICLYAFFVLSSKKNRKQITILSSHFACGF